MNDVRLHPFQPGARRSRTLLIIAAAAFVPACASEGPRFDEEEILAHIATLSSDEFGGRAPASPGEEKTVAHLVAAFEELGLEPGNPDGTWTQSVPLLGSTATRMEAASDPGGAWTGAVDFVAWTKRLVPEVEAGGELLFVGYGVQAPEYGWDDFGETDLSGRILVILVNDPPGEHHFGGDAMTYYGRWTYKFEKAAAMGALGALIVHETGPAGYPWEVVSGSWTGEQFDLRSPDGNMDRLQVEGWISREHAVALFDALGMDFEEARGGAAEADFTPIPLGIEANFSLATTHREIDSNNVVALVPGSESPEELLIYTAHWDHLGTVPEMEGDNIYNGALDNATGTSGLIALAEAFMTGPAPRRSVLFLAVTAEEQGLIGSRHYASNPLYPTRDTVAAVNLDGMNVWGRTSDIIVVGLGQSELDGIAESVATGLGRVLRPDPEPEKGFYYRSDHFEMAKVGIPAFYPDAGIDFIGKPEGFGIEVRERYTAEAYHKPGDEVQDWYDLAGMVDDLEFLYRMGRELTDSGVWPGWSETSEFRARRLEDRPR